MGISVPKPHNKAIKNRAFSAGLATSCSPFMAALGVSMIRATAILISVLLSANVSAEGWKWEVINYNPKEAVVVTTPAGDGYSAFSEAVQSIDEGVWIKHVRLGHLNQTGSPSFQEEIYSYIDEHHPNELKAALNSAGNMHNPKVVALREAFGPALLSTSYVKSLNGFLSKRCHEIVKASYEKFVIYKHKELVEFHAMVWLGTREHLTNHEGAQQSCAPS